MRQVADIDNRQHVMTREFEGVREVLGEVWDNQTRLEQRVPVQAHNELNRGVNNANRVPSLEQQSAPPTAIIYPLIHNKGDNMGSN